MEQRFTPTMEIDFQAQGINSSLCLRQFHKRYEDTMKTSVIHDLLMGTVSIHVHVLNFKCLSFSCLSENLYIHKRLNSDVGGCIGFSCATIQLLPPLAVRKYWVFRNDIHIGSPLVLYVGQPYERSVSHNN